MTRHHAVIESIKGAGSLFLLFCMAAVFGILLLGLLVVSYTVSFIKLRRTG